MKRTLMDWRRPVGFCCLALSAFAVSSNSAAQNAEPPPEQNQQVDAAAKKLMAANGLFNRGLFKQAAQVYDEFLAQYPAHAQATAARYWMAVCQYRVREFDKAVEQLDRVVQDQKFAQRDEALAVLGHCQLALKHYDEAVAAFDELVSKYPDSKQAEPATLNRGQVLYLAGKYADAAKRCQAYLEKYPKGASWPDALYFLALSQRGLKQNDAAVATLRELTGKYPDSPRQVDALLVMGQALEADGRLQPAVEAYRQMLAAAPELRKPDAHYSLGVALYKSGNYEQAASEFSTLISEFPSNAFAKPARLQLGLSQLEAKKTGEARNTLDQVVRESPDLVADARYGLAKCDITDEQYDSARRVLDELLAMRPQPPNYVQAAIDHAFCTMKLQQFQQAVDELESFRSQHGDAPQLGQATYWEAFCLHKLAKYDQSHDLCQQAAKLNAPEVAQANTELDAENLFLLKKYPEAERQFASLAHSATDDSRRLRFTFRQGQCEYFANNFAKAAEILQPVASDPKLSQNPELQQANLLLGDALLQQGKAAEAVAPLKAYLQLAKSDRPQAQYTLGVAELKSNQPQAARQAFDDASQGPSDSEWVQRALFERGQIDLKDKRIDQAADAFNRVVASNAPADVAAPAGYQLGWAEFEAKRFPQAAEAWKQMADKYPKDKYADEAAFQQGVALREAKQLNEAAEALKAYAAAHPDGKYAVKARQLAASCLKDLGKNDQALAMLSELARAPNAAGADAVLYDLAWAQRDAKDTSAAQTTYRRLLSEHADSKFAPAARTELGQLLYNDKKYEDAAQFLGQAVADKSADAKTVAIAEYYLGLCYEKLNKPDKAAAALAAYTLKGGATDDMNASALLEQGLSLASAKDSEKAAQALSQMLQKYPTYKDAQVAMIKLGQVQADMNSFDASAQTYRLFLEKNPDSKFAYQAHFGIGWALENQKKYDEARKEYQKVIAATNGQTAARAQFQIGETFLAEGSFDKAIPQLLAVEDVYKYPQWAARALFEAGRAFEQLKEKDQAKKQYTEIVTKYKDAPEAEMAQQRLKSL